MQEGDCNGFHVKLKDAKKVMHDFSLSLLNSKAQASVLRIFDFALFQELVLSISRASEESTEFIYSAVVKLQVYKFRLALKYVIWMPNYSFAKITFYSLLLMSLF